MTGHRITLKNMKFKDGKLTSIPSYGRNASAKIAAKKSKRVRVAKRSPG